MRRIVLVFFGSALAGSASVLATDAAIGQLKQPDLPAAPTMNRVPLPAPAPTPSPSPTRGPSPAHQMRTIAECTSRIPANFTQMLQECKTCVSRPVPYVYWQEYPVGDRCARDVGIYHP